jgi:hypothetical protein
VRQIATHHATSPPGNQAKFRKFTFIATPLREGRGI